MDAVSGVHGVTAVYAACRNSSRHARTAVYAAYGRNSWTEVIYVEIVAQIIGGELLPDSGERPADILRNRRRTPSGYFTENKHEDVVEFVERRGGQFL